MSVDPELLNGRCPKCKALFHDHIKEERLQQLDAALERNIKLEAALARALADRDAAERDWVALGKALDDTRARLYLVEAVLRDWVASCDRSCQLNGLSKIHADRARALMETP